MTNHIALRLKTGIVLKKIELKLGNLYHVYWSGKWISVRLIQVTEYGYNFYYQEEYRCILKRHMYVPKKLREKYPENKKHFIVSNKLIIKDPK